MALPKRASVESLWEEYLQQLNKVSMGEPLASQSTTDLKCPDVQGLLSAPLDSVQKYNDAALDALSLTNKK